MGKTKFATEVQRRASALGCPVELYSVFLNVLSRPVASHARAGVCLNRGGALGWHANLFKTVASISQAFDPSKHLIDTGSTQASRSPGRWVAARQRTARTRWDEPCRKTPASTSRAPIFSCPDISGKSLHRRTHQRMIFFFPFLCKLGIVFFSLLQSEV